MTDLSIAVVTTFPDHSWPIYSQKMLQSFVQFWPAEVPLCIQLDDDLLSQQIKAILRPQDAVAVGWGKDHKLFIERNFTKESQTDYRKQPIRFCHKVFALSRALDATLQQKAAGEPYARYLVWMDADVLTERKVTFDDLKQCLPKEGDAVAYLGRKDWGHSECGWLAFDLEKGGDKIIIEMFRRYITDEIFKEHEWHDSWIFDSIIKGIGTNLTADKPGMDIWPHSPMAAWSRHYKGPEAKSALIMNRQPAQEQMIGQKVIINTKNSIPDEQIRKHIEKNQSLIKNWVRPCKKNNEEIVVVSAGPMLIAEEVRKEQKAGRKIIAVKHALQPLKKAGIKPWACILLDPRPHVCDFVQDADPSIIWFVASQVNPQVTMELLARGCSVWGYHASVGAGEDELILKQSHAIISGGSATATRGLHTLKHMGFNNMRLYGYDLCIPDKPDLNARDDKGQPKYFEMSVGMNDPQFSLKRHFWSEPQLIAQFEELNEIINNGKMKLKAFGDGVIPFLLRAKNASDLRNRELRAKMMGKPITYKEMLYGTKSAA